MITSLFSIITVIYMYRLLLSKLMPRKYRSRKRQDDSAVTSLLVLGVLGLGISAWQRESSLLLIYGSLVILALVIIAFIVLNERRKQERLAKSGINEIDNMSGLDFEKYLRALLLRRGFRNVSLTTTYDLGVDLIAEKDGYKYGIQAKRYKGKVGLDSVRQVVAAANHYGCDRTMVITNSYFTENAKVIAKSTNCDLIDRERLIKIILTDGSDSPRP